MDIEDHSRAERLRQKRCNDEEIGRVVYLDDGRPSPEREPGELKRGQAGERKVLPEEPQPAGISLSGYRKAVHGHAFDRFARRPPHFSHRNHVDREARADSGPRLPRHAWIGRVVPVHNHAEPRCAAHTT
jgi:hypothetical protein